MKQIFNKVLLIFTLISFTFILLFSLFYNSNIYYKQNSFISLAVSGCILCLWYLIYYVIRKKLKDNVLRKHEKLFLILYFFIILLIQVFIVYNLSVTPGWDFGVVFENAKQFVLTGSRSGAVYYEYFELFPNNILLFLILTVFIKTGFLIGLTAFQSAIIMNLFFINLAILLLYLSIKKELGIKCALFGSILLLFFLPVFLYTPIFYSDTLSMFIPILFIYIYINIDINKKIKVKNILLFMLLGVIAFIGKNLKVTAVFMLISILFDYILNKKYLKRIISCFIIVLTYLFLNFLFSFIVNSEKLNFNVTGYGSYPYTHWLMMGVEDIDRDNSGRNSYGGYNLEDYELSRNFKTGKDAVNFNIDEFIRRVRKMGSLQYANYLIKKGVNAWADGLYFSDVALSIYSYHEQDRIYELLFENKIGKYTLIYFCQGVQFAFLIVLLVGSIYNFANENIDYKRLSILALMLFLLFWENRSRYLLNYVPIFIYVIVEFYKKLSLKTQKIENYLLKLYNKYKEIIMYVIFGGLTTIINFITFYALDKLGIGLYFNNTISWIVSVVFAYITNKKYVFKSKNSNLKLLLKEIIFFFGARVFSYFVDMFSIWLLFDILDINKFLSKIISNVIVIIINYIVSKLLIFKDNN